MGDDTVGRFKVALTADENGVHGHDFSVDNDRIYKGPGVWIESGDSYNLLKETDYTTEDSGLGTPHENCPPSYGVYIWERTA